GWEIVAWGEGHRPQLVAHAPAGHHLPSQGARLLDVVFGTCRAATVDHLLGGPAAHPADDPRLQVFLSITVLVVVWALVRHPPALAARDAPPPVDRTRARTP